MDIMSQRIYNKRKELGLTMEELGKKIGVTKSTISKWEKGNVSNIKSSNIASLSRVFGVTPLWLMGDDEDKIAESEIGKLIHSYTIKDENNDILEVLIDESSKLNYNQLQVMKRYIELMIAFLESKGKTNEER